jgi:spore coat polysaccharide biosynthesis protein SpsF
MKVVAIIQARTGSTRLPGKVLKKINGITMLERVVERVKLSKEIDDLTIATSIEKNDDKIEALAKRFGVKCFRGNHHDVLDRYYKCAKKNKVDIIVRITADCPLISPHVIDKVIKAYFSKKVDYALAMVKETPKSYPKGSSVEVFSFKKLKEIYRKAKTKEQREHVTIYFVDNSSKYKILWVEAEPELMRPNYRLTVDTKEDLELIRKIYSFFPANKFVTLADAIKLLDEKPELIKTNLSILQKEYSEKNEKAKN